MGAQYRTDVADAHEIGAPEAVRVGASGPGACLLALLIDRPVN